jgi:hypothetical protein
MPRRPDIAQAVEHLGKYSTREPWVAHRRAHLERMLGRLLERFELDLEALYEEVTELGHAGTLFGFLEESFLAAELGPGKANVIDDYLKRRGWQETPRAREYLLGIRTTPVSLYEVHAVVPGEWLELKDVYRGGPPQRIAEESGSRSLERWDRVVARVVEARGEAMLTGGILPMTRDSTEALEGILTRSRDKGRRAAEALARKHGVDLELVADVDETLLRVGDPVFLQLWLKGLLDVRRRPLPGLANTDGEALLFSKTRLPLAPDGGAEVIRRMEALEGWVREQEDAAAWIWQPVPGATRTIHASARFEDGTLVVETNSHERMERALAVLRPALGALVGEALTSHEDPAQRLSRGTARGAGRAAAEEPPLQGPEIEAVIRQFKDAHYRRVLDEPVPMLGDKTPRVRALEGRPRPARPLAQAARERRAASGRRERAAGVRHDVDVAGARRAAGARLLIRPFFALQAKFLASIFAQ